MKIQPIFHVISNTHWDREWRFPFQKNRRYLVEMINKTLEILENYPEYRAFHLDSQSVVIQDYLEIQPKKKPLIKKFVTANRLLIGPWFILPEEFQVGGESLIRNLLLGHRICRELGGVMKVGYTPFSWGQISQLPQIYREFDIDLVMFYRGINSLDSPKAEFIWEGADGTRLLSSRFSTMPRYNFYFYIYRPVVHDEQISDLEYKWEKGRMPFHWTDTSLYEEDFYLLENPTRLYDKNLKKSVNAIIKDQLNDFTTPHIFWAEGHDSSGPSEHTIKIIKKINRFIKNGRVIHSTLEEYANALKKTVNYQSLRIVKGERRSSQYDRRSGNLYGYTTSARMYLKQLNFDTERWLQFYAEPFQTIAEILGMEVDDEYLEIAWNLLLQNSAHDSIGGCSRDEIHSDMEYRYKHCQEISKGVFDRALKFLAQKLYPTSSQPNNLHLIIVNPYPQARSEIIKCYIDIPRQLDKGSLEFRNALGNSVPLQISNRKYAQPVLEQLINRPLYLNSRRFECYLEVDDIPALGFLNYRVHPTKTMRKKEIPIGRMVNGLPVLENSFLKVSVQRNGTIKILDKLNKIRFKNLGYFFDEGEKGHAWVHTPVKPVITSLRSRPLIEMVENGPLYCSCRIKHQLEIPAGLTSTGKRSTEKRQLPIIMTISLNKLSRHVEFQIDLENYSENHRLRLMFPTHRHPEYSYGEGQFDVVARPADRKDYRGWIEKPMPDYPMHHFVDLWDGEKGAAVIVDGLKEYEYLSDKNGTLAITLIRAFTYTIQPSSLQDFSHQKGSQCLGKQSYRLAFYPHSGNWQEGAVYPEAIHFNLPLKSFLIGGAKPQSSSGISFLEIEPKDIIFSCFKKAEGQKKKFYILRVYNPTDSTHHGKFTFYPPLNSVTQVTLEEKTTRRILSKDDYSFHCSIAPKKIVTFKISFK